MIREVDLLQYLPPFVARYREMAEIMKTEEPELQLLWDATELVKNMSFVLYCGIEGVERYEKMFKLYPEPDDTLEDRRIRILAYMNNDLPYTWRALLRKLEILVSDGDYEAIGYFFDDLEYTMKVNLINVSNATVSETRKMLQRMIPCNMVWWIVNYVTWLIRTKNRTWARVGVRAKAFMYTQPVCRYLDGTWELDGSVMMGGLPRDRVPARVFFRDKYQTIERLRSNIKRLNGAWELDGDVILNQQEHELKMQVIGKVHTSSFTRGFVDNEPV